MKTRLLTSAIFVLLLAVGFILKYYVSNYFFDVLILAISCLAAYEALKIFAKIGKYNDRNLALVFPIFLMTLQLIGVAFDKNISILYTILLSVLLIVVFFGISFLKSLIFIKKSKLEIKTRGLKSYSVLKYSVIKALNTSLVFIYPAFLLNFLTLINHFDNLTTSFEGLANINGYVSIFILLFAFLIPIFTDTFAYLVGGLFGGKKLAPKISPNKTISGAIGGLVMCVLLTASVFCIFNSFTVINESFVKLGLNIWKIVIISFIGSILGQAGDLCESYLKRSANVKDSGKILPGHGGMLDRFDSHIFVAPFVFIAFSIIFALI